LCRTKFTRTLVVWVQARRMDSICMLHTNGDQEYIAAPRTFWPTLCGWGGTHSRKIEFYEVLEGVWLSTKLYFDATGLDRPDIQPFNLTLPELNGHVILASYLGRMDVCSELLLDVRKLYGDDGVAALLENPVWKSSRKHVSCDEVYLMQKARELQSISEIE